MDWEQARAIGHVTAAVAALATGAAVFALPKGTPRHKLLGAGYVVSLLLVNAAALSLRREDTFGAFHVLALVSLITLAVGIAPLALGKRSQKVIVTHAYCMAWSYAGLVAAGCGQLAAAYAENDGGWVVLEAIGTVLLLCAATITVRVPITLARTLPHTLAHG